VAHRRKALGDQRLVPLEARPILKLVDVGWHSPHSLRRLWPVFTASVQINRRTECGD
jgi:hypothetical protein